MEIAFYPRYFLRGLFVHGRQGFFKAGYRLMYPECSRHGMTPWQHYVLEGMRKGYDTGNNPPDTLFFPEGYAAEYPDVRDAGCDPWHHFAEKGQKEGRDNGLHPDSGLFFPEGYLAMYPDAKDSRMDAWHHYVLIGMKEGRGNGSNPTENLFFREGYEAEYPDVSACGDDPWHHYVLTGMKEGRDNGLHPDSGLFFPEGYLAMYPDAAESRMDPWHHYVLTGMKEGRDSGLHPGKERFYAAGYLAMYPDAENCGMDAWHHYVLKGMEEGRDNGNNPPETLFFPEGYEAEYPEVKAEGADPWHHYAEKGQKEGHDSGLHPDSEKFYAAGYLAMYPDAAESGMDPWHHYAAVGVKEGRGNGNNPPPEVFFPEGYELEYPEVKAEVVDPWRDYAEKGRREGRDNGLNPGKDLFSTECYLEMYPDAAESGMDAWHHYVLIGRKAGRDSGIHPSGDGSTLVSWPDASHFYSKNILIIAELSIPQCKLYRVDQKVIALERQGYKVLVSPWTDRTGSISLMQGCSVVIFYRVPWREDVIASFKEAKRLGIHTVFDIDDLVFDTEVYGQVLRDTQKSESEKADLIDGVRLYCDAMLQADENWFSTRTLCELSDHDFGTKSVCIPNCIPEELPRVAEEFEGERKESGTVTIFYGAGSSTHDRDIAEIADVLEQLLLDNDNVRLLLIGDIKFGFRNAELREKITRIGRLDLTDYYYLISQSDIAVVPLEQSLFNTAKSNIKYIEASVFRVPSVCSDLCEFSSVIRNGENGFIARDRKEWADCLQRLIDSRKLCARVGNAAYKTVTKLYSLDALGAKLSSLVEPYAAERNRNKKGTALLVNVRYGLSGKGTTASAVEDLAEEIRQAGGLDVHVFSTYTDSHDPFGTLRRYGWHGVNVWAVNIATVNWGWSDAGIRNIFARVLDLVSPELVHFHSIQTLGMDMCLECIERKIPYFVTMHDGWWVCARKFLTDTRGRWCGEKLPSGTMCRTKCGVSNCDFYRKRHLAQYILRSAEKVYTPTDYLTDLIKGCFPTVEVKTQRSGIPETRRNAACADDGDPDVSGRIVLGFAGGRNCNSGYFLLKECLESLGDEKESFRLLFALGPGERCDESRILDDDWPVETVIEDYQDVRHVPDALLKMDVLLSPLMRKEPFGLIVREAIKNDVFVVSSECGGPAEAIVNHENGFLFPMGDREKLMECLRLLIKKKDFIMSYRTRNFGDIRTYKEQADELLMDFAAIHSHVGVRKGVSVKPQGAAAC